MRNKKLCYCRGSARVGGHTRRSESFNVTDFDMNRKPVCRFLLVNNINFYHILHRFQVIADYWCNFRCRREGYYSSTY